MGRGGAHTAPATAPVEGQYIYHLRALPWGEPSNGGACAGNTRKQGGGEASPTTPNVLRARAYGIEREGAGLMETHCVGGRGWVSSRRQGGQKWPSRTAHRCPDSPGFPRPRWGWTGSASGPRTSAPICRDRGAGGYPSIASPACRGSQARGRHRHEGFSEREGRHGRERGGVRFPRWTIPSQGMPP